MDKWEDIQPQPMQKETSRETKVLCPKCGKRLWKRLDVVLTSYPPQYVYQCHNCGFEGFNY